MFKFFLSLFSGCVVSLASSIASSSTVTLVPSKSTLGLNEVFTIDLVLDANDAVGPHPGLYSGSVTIDYDPAVLVFNNSTGFTEAITGTTMVSTSGAGSRNTVTVGFGGVTFNVTPDAGSLGVFTFQANGMPSTATLVDINDTNGLGSFVNSAGSQPGDPINEFFPVPGDVTLNIQTSAVPLPAAAWLMLSGLGLFGFSVRRKKCDRCFTV